MYSKIDLSQRTDISQFIIHLTRETDGASAMGNLLNILNGMKIEARNYHCLFNSKLDKECEEIQNKFKVVCFTETPLSKLKQTIGPFGKKTKIFEPYGIIFRKGGLRSYEESGLEYLANYPNPVFYVDGDNKKLVSSLYSQFDRHIEESKNGVNDDFFLIGAMVNIVNGRHDFSWEREWRTIGDFQFIIPDVVAVIAPEEEHEEIRKEINYDFNEAISFIDIKWSMEEMLSRLSGFAWNNWYKYYHEKNN